MSGSILDVMSTSSVGASKSMWTAYVFVINVVFGSGVLAMPHAIQTAGLGLGILMLGGVTVVAWVTVMWTVETISRLSFLESLWHDLIVREEEKEDGPMVPKQDFEPDVVQSLTTCEGFDSIDESCTAEVSQIHKLWEVNQLCIAFLGKKVGMGYDVCLCLYTWAVMWLYVSVWCQAFVSIVSQILPSWVAHEDCDDMDHTHCLRAYRITIAVFTVVMALLCVKEWKIFNKIQSAFTIYAYVCLFVMLVSVAVGLCQTPYNPYQGDAPIEYTSDSGSTYHPDAPENSSRPYLGHGNKFADFGQFGLLFGCCIFSQMAHQGTAQILFVMSKKQKAGLLFAVSFLTTMLFYVVLSVAAALYFGDQVNSIVTLNWKHFSWYSDGHQDWATDVLFVLIVVFPVGTTSAAYMFFVRTLGQQMEYWLTKQLFPFISNKVLCKIVAFVPPILGGLATHNVKTIVTVAGLLGFLIMIFFPAALQLRSVAILKRLGASHVTPFSSVHSSEYAVYVMLVVGSAGFVYYIYNMTQTS